MSNSGYELSFDDFEQVLNDYMDEIKARKIFARDIGIIVKLLNREFKFYEPDGGLLSHQKVHKKIQSNKEVQRAFYNFAMTNWH